MWEFLHQMLKNPIIGLVWGLIGFLIGNRLVIGRDKRREFNKIIEPIRTALIREINDPGRFDARINTTDIFKTREALPLWKRRRFDTAVEEYKQSKGDNNIKRTSTGGWYFKNKEIIFHKATKLLKFVKKK